MKMAAQTRKGEASADCRRITRSQSALARNKKLNHTAKAMRVPPSKHVKFPVGTGYKRPYVMSDESYHATLAAFAEQKAPPGTVILRNFVVKHLNDLFEATVAYQTTSRQIKQMQPRFDEVTAYVRDTMGDTAEENPQTQEFRDANKEYDETAPKWNKLVALQQSQHHKLDLIRNLCHSHLREVLNDSGLLRAPIPPVLRYSYNDNITYEETQRHAPPPPPAPTASEVKFEVAYKTIRMALKQRDIARALHEDLNSYFREERRGFEYADQFGEAEETRTDFDLRLLTYGMKFVGELNTAEKAYEDAVQQGIALGVVLPDEERTSNFADFIDDGYAESVYEGFVARVDRGRIFSWMEGSNGPGTDKLTSPVEWDTETVKVWDSISMRATDDRREKIDKYRRFRDEVRDAITPKMRHMKDCVASCDDVQ